MTKEEKLSAAREAVESGSYEEVERLVAEESLFNLIKRGESEIKGKGKMHTYFLERA